MRLGPSSARVELRLMVGELLRSQVCRSSEGIWSTQESWKAAMRQRGGMSDHMPSLNCPKCGQVMRYVESKTDPQMHVCECPVHKLYHFGPKTDLTESPPTTRWAPSPGGPGPSNGVPIQW
jgi:hypothetical protein